MPVIKCIIVLCLAAAALWSVNTYITANHLTITLMNIVALVLLTLYILSVLGVFGKIPGTSIDW